MKLLLVVVLLLSGCGGSPASKAPTAVPTPRATSPIVGVFVRWQSVDEKNGYAHFTLTNNGTAVATAKCTIRVRNDFGNFGFDTLAGAEVPPGETIKGYIPMSVGSGSKLINQGEVTDC